MNLRHLRYFVAVAQAGSFRKAAEQLHVAQPALTRRITALEKELGVPLFEPESRRRTLGPAGKLFAKEAVAILANVESSVQRVRQLDLGQDARLRIGFVDISSGDAAFASFMEQLRASLPHAHIDMVPMGTLEQLKALLQGRIDAGCLCCLPQMDKRLAVRPLTDHTMIAILPRSHPLARQQKLMLRDLQRTSLVFVSRAVRADLHRIVAEAFRKQALPLPRTEEASNSAQVISMVAVGAGIGLLMSAAKSRLPAGLVSRPIADLRITYRLAMAWNLESKNTAVAKLASIAGDEARARSARSARSARRMQLS